MIQELTAFSFNTRVLYFVLAAVLLVSLAWPTLRRRLAQACSAIDNKGDERRFLRSILIGACALFVICLISKYSQLRSHLVYGSDYWAFADMIHWMSIGKAYVTRYIFFDLGPIQHGSNHSFFSLFLFVPLAWLFGGGFAALVMNPLSFALGIFACAFVSYRWTSSRLVAVGVASSLLMANLMGRAFQYECHPETFYVALVLIAAYLWEKTWSFKGAVGAVGALGAVIVWLVLSGMKQDGLFIGASVGLWLLSSNFKSYRKVALAAVLSVSVFAVMTWTIRQFGERKIGPTQVTIGSQLIDVDVITRGSVIVGGQKLSGVGAIREMVKIQIDKRGSLSAFVLDVLTYPFRNPFVFLILMAPWVLLRRDFWTLVYPMALVFGVFSGPMAQLNSYYGASVLGLMFVSILSDLRKSMVVSGSGVVQSKKFLYAKLVWLFCFSAIHGSSGIPYYQPSEYSLAMDREAADISSSLEGLGVVSSSLLRVVDQEKIYSDHVEGGGKTIPDFVGWVLYPKFSESWDFKATGFTAWKDRALASGAWELVPGKNVDLLRRKN